VREAPASRLTKLELENPQFLKLIVVTRYLGTKKSLTQFTVTYYLIPYSLFRSNAAAGQNKAMPIPVGFQTLKITPREVYYSPHS